MKKKILIVTPRSPFQGRGADEQDRLSGILWFIERGYAVRVITKVFSGDMPAIELARNTYNIPIHAISYKYTGKKKLFTLLKRILFPLYWDGAAFEYFDKEIQDVVASQIKEFAPDLMWCDYTYLWPLYHHAKRNNVPIVTRSINYEPQHFLDEDGESFFNHIRALPKYLSERRAFQKSDFFFAITPNEMNMYKTLGDTPVATLPLRSLPSRIIERVPTLHSKITVGFMPSTYTVHHNKEALMFIIEKVIPALSPFIRSKIEIHVTGNKFPEEMKDKLPSEVVYDGFVPSSIDFWQSMDIALAPSLFGAGMQQKIFEPIVLGVPTITSARGLAGYPFKCGEHVICAVSAEETADALIQLVQSEELRQRMTQKAQALSQMLFSRNNIDMCIQKALQTI